MKILYFIELVLKKYLIVPLQKLVFKNNVNFNLAYIMSEVFLVVICVFLFVYFIGGNGLISNRGRLKTKEDK
ncbi:hypothetical protein ACOAKC_12950 [Hathewaya histolytica]|uniref:hypothetical protein n=1 Tax=Hathewaya histolytica TaxID=1498 RepID=UPI003B674A7A